MKYMFDVISECFPKGLASSDSETGFESSTPSDVRIGGNGCNSLTL